MVIRLEQGCVCRNAFSFYLSFLCCQFCAVYQYCCMYIANHSNLERRLENFFILWIYFIYLEETNSLAFTFCIMPAPINSKSSIFFTELLEEGEENIFFQKNGQRHLLSPCRQWLYVSYASNMYINGAQCHAETFAQSPGVGVKQLAQLQICYDLEHGK